MIDGALGGSSVTCVLIGRKTWERPWARYELLKRFERGNGALEIRIHNCSITMLAWAEAGADPLNYLGFTVDDRARRLMLLEYVHGAWRANEHVGTMALENVHL